MLVKVSQHAKERATERFGVPKSEAARWIQSVLAKARYVGEVVGEDGATCHAYAWRRICVLLNEDKSRVVTVYERHTVLPAIREKVEALIDREIERLKRREAWFIRRHRRMMAELELEKAELKVEMLATRSMAKRLACQARINAIDMKLAELNEELREIQRQRSAVVKSKVVVI